MAVYLVFIKRELQNDTLPLSNSIALKILTDRILAPNGRFKIQFKYWMTIENI